MYSDILYRSGRGNGAYVDSHLRIITLKSAVQNLREMCNYIRSLTCKTDSAQEVIKFGNKIDITFKKIFH
jgi:hypothetical protein